MGRIRAFGLRHRCLVSNVATAVSLLLAIATVVGMFASVDIVVMHDFRSTPRLEHYLYWTSNGNRLSIEAGKRGSRAGSIRYRYWGWELHDDFSWADVSVPGPNWTIDFSPPPHRLRLACPVWAIELGFLILPTCWIFRRRGGSDLGGFPVVTSPPLPV